MVGYILQREFRHSVVKRQSIALFVCMAGLLIVAVINILNQHASELTHSRATTAARDWSTYLVEKTPGIEAIMAGKSPARMALESFARGNATLPVRSFTLFNISGKVVFQFKPEIDKSPRQSATSTNAKTISKPLVVTSTSPIIISGRTLGTIAVFLNPTDPASVYRKAAAAGAWELLILLNLSLLCCWFTYGMLKQTAKRHNASMNRFDELTGLPSRFGFVHELDKTLDQPTPLRKQVAVLAVKIDRFREINDIHGHRGADLVLCKVATTLQKMCQDGGFASRLSGNTFGLIFSSVDGQEDTRRLGDRIIEAIRVPIMIGGKRILPKASIGISIAPEHGNGSQSLLRHAELAQFMAHENGGNQCRFYDKDTAADFAELHRLERLVESACEDDLFDLYFQPLHDLKSQQLCGFEALLRLQDEDGNFVPPDKFIPVAETLHRIDEIGSWVLAEACQTAAQWPEPLCIAVNLSPIQFDSGNLVDVVRSALTASKLDPCRLELEVTEGLLLEHTDKTRLQLDQLQEMGIKIALDDFGTGYSSLSYLWRFPFDRIKIDRSFVCGMDESEQAANILVTIVELARTMKMAVTAEGIETTEQLDYLTRLGCDTGQGYLLGRPQPASDIAATVIVDFKNQIDPGYSAAVPRPEATIIKISG